MSWSRLLLMVYRAMVGAGAGFLACTFFAAGRRADDGREIARLRSLLAEAEGVRASMRAANARLAADLGRAQECLAFFAIVIKSGEPWTAECERKLRSVHAINGAQAINEVRP